MFFGDLILLNNQSVILVELALFGPLEGFKFLCQPHQLLVLRLQQTVHSLKLLAHECYFAFVFSLSPQ